MPPAPESTADNAAEETGEVCCAAAEVAAVISAAVSAAPAAAANAPAQSPGHAGGHALAGRSIVARDDTRALPLIALPLGGASKSANAESSEAVAMRTATADVAAVPIAPSPMMSVRGPHTPAAVALLAAPLHRAEKDGVVTLSSDPSGDTQFTVARTPPRDTVVAALNAAPAE